MTEPTEPLKARLEAELDRVVHESPLDGIGALADAALSVVGPELDRLRAAHVSKLHDALGIVGAEEDIDPYEAVVALHTEVDRLREERDRARWDLAKVGEALTGAPGDSILEQAKDLRAAASKFDERLGDIQEEVRKISASHERTVTRLTGERDAAVARLARAEAEFAAKASEALLAKRDRLRENSTSIGTRCKGLEEAAGIVRGLAAETPEPTPEPTIDPLPNGGEWFPAEGDPFDPANRCIPLDGAPAPEPTAEAEPACAPRVFRAGDEEPEDRPTLRDSSPGAGFTWTTPMLRNGMWGNEMGQWVRWEKLLEQYGPLTEVVGEDR